MSMLWFIITFFLQLATSSMMLQPPNKLQHCGHDQEMHSGLPPQQIATIYQPLLCFIFWRYVIHKLQDEIVLCSTACQPSYMHCLSYSYDKRPVPI
uniref:Secreted protein n=1 Tax=Arion vulgaris TaxID=1028688 RepID=A0A0B6ZZM9_9EUPU